MSIERAQAIPHEEISEKIYSVCTQQSLVCILKLFADGRTPDNITIVRAYLASRGEASTQQDALRWINIMFGYAPRIASVAEGDGKKRTRFRIYDTYPLEDEKLIAYLNGQGISEELARHHVYEARVCNKRTGERFNAIAHMNEDNGHELSAPSFCGGAGRRNVTVIRGTCGQRDAVHVFVKMVDYLSALEIRQKGPLLKNDAIILNDMRNLPRATPYIYQYGYRTGFTWMHNNRIGHRATQALRDYFLTQDLPHRPRNVLYRDFISLNAFHAMRQASKALTHS